MGTAIHARQTLKPVAALGQRAWEGHVEGNHWIARVIELDEGKGICALHVATGHDRDAVVTKPNCRWDYECDHFLDRFSDHGVPVGVTCEMLEGLRQWLENYRMRKQGATDGAHAGQVEYRH